MRGPLRVRSGSAPGIHLLDYALAVTAAAVGAAATAVGAAATTAVRAAATTAVDAAAA